MKNTKIAILLHPISMELFYSQLKPLYGSVYIFFSLLIKIFPAHIVKKFYSKLPPHKFMITNKIMLNNQSIQLVGIMCPIFPEQMVLNKRNALSKINASIKLAEKIGVKYLTLAAFTSIVSKGGEELIKNKNVCITTGNTLTAALCIQKIRRLLMNRNIYLKSITIAVIGASGDIGSACSKYYLGKVKKIILCSRGIAKMSPVYNNIVSSYQDKLTKIVIENDANSAISNADVVIIATSAFGVIISQDRLKKGAIVCDVSMPANITQGTDKKENKNYIFEGGKASLGFYDLINDEKWSVLFPENSIYGCFSESIVLALENKFTNYSFGKNKITVEKMNEIYELSIKNGIEPA